MPRTHSSKKPGCFNQVKPTLMFTDSPAERLPRRLCSPISAADNPVTAQVLYMEDGLETTWVSPQFHPSMLEMEEAPRRRRRKQDGDITGKSAMATQHTTRKRRPVRKSSVTTPNPGETRFPKGFQPLQFLGDSSRSRRRDGGEWKRIMGEEDEDEDVRIDDEDDDGICLEDSTAFRMEQTRKRTSTKNVFQRYENEEFIEAGVNNHSSYHGNRISLDALDRLQNQSRIRDGRRSVTRSRTSSVSGRHSNSRHPYRDDDVGEGDFHPHRLTVLREKAVTSNTNRRHQISSHRHDLSGSPDENFEYNENFSGLVHDWGPRVNESCGQSPIFNQSKRKKARGDAARKKLEKFAADTHQFGDASVHPEEQYLLADLNQTGHDGLQTSGEVLAADTPVSDYGLRVSLRRRRHLLPKHYTERLLLDS